MHANSGRWATELVLVERCVATIFKSIFVPYNPLTLCVYERVFVNILKYILWKNVLESSSFTSILCVHRRMQNHNILMFYWIWQKYVLSTVFCQFERKNDERRAFSKWKRIRSKQKRAHSVSSTHLKGKFNLWFAYNVYIIHGIGRNDKSRASSILKIIIRKKRRKVHTLDERIREK